MTFSTTTPLGYIGKAEAYRVGAQLLAVNLDGVGGWADDPTRYLYYHSVELYLKSIMISAGLSEAALRKVGHGFDTMVDKADELGIDPLDELDRTIVTHINLSNRYERARYHEVGFFKEFRIGPLDGAAYAIALRAVQFARARGLRVRSPKGRLPSTARLIG